MASERFCLTRCTVKGCTSKCQLKDVHRIMAVDHICVHRHHWAVTDRVLTI